MLSLCLVGSGKEDLREFISYIGKEFNNFAKETNAHVYSESRIDRAEFDKELLSKSTSMSFPLGNRSRVYYGAFDVEDIDALHSHLYSMPDMNTREDIWFFRSDRSRECVEYYSPARLRNHILRLSDMSRYTPDKHLLDFEIKYKCHSFDGYDLCSFEISADKEPESFDLYKYFEGIITSLDSRYPNQFLSAYIGDVYAEGERVVSDFEMLATKLPDTQKAFYVSQKLKDTNGITEKDNDGYASATELSNGTYYVPFSRDGGIENELLNKLIIPHCVFISWSKISTIDSYWLSHFDTVMICYDGEFDPTIIFSFGYEAEQLNELFECRGMSIGAKYPKKLFFEHKQ